ncbi:hypothetical protein QQS21_009532 [Conoideocrella luteorostrata]|uniref:Uncharacterized protein n=1 Tax=Conoideocrella luteorostrata TaxID=1105319 RepID=A0AAJ0CGQ5_9HYPO|nr:hypothetical protein QQS21_009532 [Conoideocrella luteorostrata]
MDEPRDWLWHDTGTQGHIARSWDRNHAKDVGAHAVPHGRTVSESLAWLALPHRRADEALRGNGQVAQNQK